MSVLAAITATALLTGAAVCLVDQEVGLCPPDDLPGPAAWMGFATDSTVCGWWGPGSSTHSLSLSASATDPFANLAPFPDDGRIYLWLIGATGSYGWSFVQVTFVAEETEVDGYERIAAGEHQWDEASRSLLFHAPDTCRPWPVSVPSQLIGAVVLKTTSVESQTWGRLRSMWR